MLNGVTLFGKLSNARFNCAPDVHHVFAVDNRHANCEGTLTVVPNNLKGHFDRFA